MELKATEPATADPAQDSSVIDLYLSATPALKSKARKAIGARNDDDAIVKMNQDGAAADAVRNIINTPDDVLTSGMGDTPIEDVMYPRRK